jgi:hypothetical protein
MYDGFCFLIMMSQRIAVESIPFGILISSVLVGFVMMYQLLHLSIFDPNDEYQSLDSTFWKLLIQQFKEASGVHVAPTINEYMTEQLKDKPLEGNIIYIMICLTWI